MTIDEQRAGDVTVLVLRGRLVLDDGDDALRNRIEGLLADGRNRLVLDLGGVDYMDSAGVGLVVSKYLSARRRGGDLKLARLSARVDHVMEIAHLLTVFEIFESHQAAVASFA
jgi:anti-sigma B factor antagonist